MGCLFKSLLRLTTKKHQRSALLSLCEGNPPKIGWWHESICGDWLRLYCLSFVNNNHRRGQRSLVASDEVWFSIPFKKQMAIPENDLWQCFLPWYYIHSPPPPPPPPPPPRTYVLWSLTLPITNHNFVIQLRLNVFLHHCRVWFSFRVAFIP